MSLPQLITVPISHYCEKARWALCRAQIDFQESGHLQLIHMIPTYLAARSDTVPVLVTDDATLDDSTLILQWAHQNGKVPIFSSEPSKKTQALELEDEFDRVLGPATRLWTYSNLLPLSELCKKYCSHGIPDWEKLVMRHTFPLIRKAIEAGYPATEKTVKRAEQKIDLTFKKVSDLLSDGRTFLVGSSFGAADLTFAALAAPILLPEQYGVPLPAPHEFSEVVASRIQGWRETPAGRFALRMYRENRC